MSPHAQHMQNVGPSLFTCNENSAYTMSSITAHAVMPCAHHMAHACRQAGHPYENVVHQKLLMDIPFAPAKLYLIKLTASHFSTLNTRIAKPECAKQQSHCHAQSMRTRLITMRTSGYVQRNL